MDEPFARRGVLLLGMKHSGKTTLGQRLAEEMGVEFADLDDITESLYDPDRRTSCREIYRRHGLEAFSELEARAAGRLAESMASRRMIAALGGGTIENPAAMDALKESGTKVYLKDEPAVLFARIMQSGLPAFLNPANPRQAFEELYERRTRLYEQQADLVVDIAGGGVDEAYARLVERIGG